MNQEGPQTPRRHKGVRLLLTLLITGVATAAIGFGGLAAWTATTENDNSSLATGTVHHSNQAKSDLTVTNATGAATVTANCTDLTSPGSCGLIINLTNAKPGAVGTGTVQITNTGTLDSKFTLGLAAAPLVTGGATLCNDLTLGVADAESPVVNPVPPGTALPSVATVAINTSNTSPVNKNSATWSATDTDTFTFTFTLPAGSANTDQGSTCTSKFLFTQTNT